MQRRGALPGAGCAQGVQGTGERPCMGMECTVTHVCETQASRVWSPPCPQGLLCGPGRVLFLPHLQASGGMCTEPTGQQGPRGAGCQINPCPPPLQSWQKFELGVGT